MTLSFPDIFNGLLSVGEANKLFTDHTVLEQLLCPFRLREHQDFAIAVVHRHTTLQYGEVMIVHPINDQGEIITQPEIMDPTKTYHESSWLSTGEPIEYSLEPQPGRPDVDGLLHDFVCLLSQTGVPVFHHDALQKDIPILGICSSPPPLPSDKIYVERTEGRRNIVTIQDNGPETQGIITLWTSVGTNCVCTDLTIKHSGVQKCHPGPCFTTGLTHRYQPVSLN